MLHNVIWTLRHGRLVMVQCVTLMLTIVVEFGILLFDYFVYLKNMTCMKRFTVLGRGITQVRWKT